MQLLEKNNFVCPHPLKCCLNWKRRREYCRPDGWVSFALPLGWIFILSRFRITVLCWIIFWGADTRAPIQYFFLNWQQWRMVVGVLNRDYLCRHIARCHFEQSHWHQSGPAHTPDWFRTKFPGLLRVKLHLLIWSWFVDLIWFDILVCQFEKVS